MKNTNIQAISLFSGAGGLDIGAKQNNIELKVSIDNDEDYKYELENIIEKTTRTFALNYQNQKDSIIDAVKISCRKITKEITGKKPLTSIKLIRI